MAGFKLSDASHPAPDSPTAERRDQPLDLTVHSLPRVEGAAVPDARRTVVGRWKMIVVMLICAAPVIASYVTYYLIRPEARRVFGELVDPQRPLPELQASTLDGAPVNLRSLKGQWLLVTVATADCNALCQQNLYLQRQIRESLGREKDRVDRVWLINDQAAVAPALLPAVKDATVLRIDPAALARWLAPAPGHMLGDHLYVVDPLGNWMMRFPAALDTAAAARAKRDLDRVLRASASWDTAGRTP